MKIGNFEINWLHLPGHCPGSSMIYLPKESVIFSGDVLFNGSIGRFDFPNSSKHDTSTSLNKIKEYDFFIHFKTKKVITPAKRKSNKALILCTMVVAFIPPNSTNTPVNTPTQRSDTV